MEPYQKALSYYEEAEAEAEQGYTLHDIGDVLNRQKKHDEALVVYRKTLAMHANCYAVFLQRLRAGKEMGDCGDYYLPEIA